MKKLFTTLLLATTILTVSAQTTIPQGGTGLSTSTPGDLLVGTSSIRYSRLPVGSSGSVLQASSTSPFRMAWVTLASIFDSLLSSNNTWTGTNTFNATTTLNKVVAGTSAGIQFFSNGFTQIADFGAGGGSNASFLGGVSVTGNLAVDTNTLYVDSANNRVGIGTTSPANKLHVYEATAATPVRLSLNNAVTGATANDGLALAVDEVGDAFVIQREAANLKLYTNNTVTNGILINSSGNVGIGTTTPIGKLSVADTSVRVRADASGSTGQSEFFAMNDVSRYTGITTYGSAKTGTVMGITRANLSEIVSFADNMVVYNSTNAPLIFGTNNTERIRISSGGNLGIGTTTPGALLTVYSTSTSGTSPVFMVATTTPIIVAQANGRVGIGSNVGTPSAPLHIFTPVANSTTVTGQYIINAGSGAGAGAELLLGYAASAAGTGGIASFYDTSHFGGTIGVKTRLSAGGTTFLTGSVTGDVGIGTTTPSARLAIQGQSGSTTPLFSIASSSGTINPILQVIPVATYGGFVGINAPTPTYQLEISSDANSTGRGLLIGQHSADVGAAVITAQKSRGTRSSPTTVVSGDYTFAFAGQSYDGSAYRNTANFGYRTSGTIASNSIPGQWFFAATSSNDTNPYTNGTVRMVIGSDGNVGIGTTTPNSVLTIASSTTSTSTSILNIFNSLSTPIMRILGSGAVLFGTITTANCGNAPCGLTVGTTTQFTAGTVARVVGYSSAASTTINLDTTDAATTTVDRATTFVNPSGTMYDVSSFEIIALATTSQTIYWGNMFASSSPLTLPSTIASGTSIYLFQYNKFTNKLLYTGFMGPFN